MPLLLPQDSLSAFVAFLAQWGKVHGPVLSEDGVFGFREIEEPESIRLDYSRTLIPPKKYLLPPLEVTHTFQRNRGYQLPAEAPGQTILLGVHRCDLTAIAYLDRAFLHPHTDEHYRLKRQKLFLVGLSCKPDQFCFCGDHSLKSPHDLFLWKRDGGFLVTAGSAAGEKALAPMLKIFRHIPAENDLRTNCETPEAEAIAAAFRRNEHFENSPLWSDFADRCLSCGACSMCCPTCYCFDVRENGNLDGTAQRIRSWDNCLFKSHGEVAGGVNFRKTREERFRYRHQHKYLGFGTVRGIISCVGCGRCREVCPVRIDLLELFHHKDPHEETDAEAEIP